MERRTFIKNTGLLGLATLVTPTGIFQSKVTSEAQDALEQNFHTPPASAKPHTWWHWMNGNVTKEGITLDLEAMKRVGIGGFQNFDAGTGIPKGPIEYLSPEWLELKKHAISEANRLGLEFTMHNCPGWSSSGGPWITPELSMQEVTWSELLVSGGKLINVNLPQPVTKLNTYKEICVLAYKSLPDENQFIKLLKRVFTNKGDIPLRRVTGENKPFIKIEPVKETAYLQFEWNQPVEIQDVSFITAAYGENRGPILLQASDDGNNFQTVFTFNTGSFMGEPRGEVLVSQSVPLFKTKHVRFACNHEREFSQIRLSRIQRAQDWNKRANYAFGRNEVADLPMDLAAISEEEIFDITAYMRPNGALSWNAPEGDWTILRFGYTPMGTMNRSAPDTGVGLECDKYSAEAFEFHFNKMMENLLPFLKPLGDNGKVGLLIDSYEVGMQNWTAGFEKIFKAKNAYDIIKCLPALTGRVVNNADFTNRFLWDFRRTQGDLMADNYYGKFNELCHKNKIISYIQPYDRGPMEEMQIGSRIDINVGEFWNNLSSIFQNNWTMRRTVKLSASIAHTNGQKVVAAESFTGEPESSKWQEHPFALKMLGDRMFAQGLNRMVFHRFAHQPHPTAKPGMTMGPWGSHFDRTNTWWEQGKAWMLYLSRCQYLLQEGSFVADLAYFTSEDAGVYAAVERNELFPVPPEGYDYDLINGETLLKKAKVVSRKLTLPYGMSYSILVLQNHKTMTFQLLSKIKEFANAGLIIIGEKPVRTPGVTLISEEKFRLLVDELWSTGKVVSGKSVAEIAKARGLKKDFEFTSRSGTAPVTYLHRQNKDTDIYLVSNQRRSDEEVVCTFRLQNRQPEIWDPVTGRIVRTRIFQHDNDRTTVSLKMRPTECVFVVFRKDTPPKPGISIKTPNGELIAPRHTDASRKTYRDVVNTFSVGVWVKPETSIMLSTNNFMDGQQPWTDFYAIFPPPGQSLYGSGHATTGLAVGRNGVAVWENNSGKPVFKVSASTPISGWAHVAIVYKDGTPSIYVNGKFLQEGTKSEHIVHPAAADSLLQEGASFFNGEMDDPDIVTDALDEAAIRQKAGARIPNAKNETTILDRGDEFILFTNGAYTVTQPDGDVSLNVRNTEPVDLSENWQVKFPNSLGAPESISLPKLHSLHLHEVPGVKYFSGTCTYEKHFKAPKKINKESRRYFIDLGEVEVIAEVTLNNEFIGTFWTRPFLIDITDHLRAENHLIVKVTNPWPNRLIGDEQAPEQYKYSPGGGGSGFASLNGGAILELPGWYKQGASKPEDGRVAFATWKHYTKDSPLLQSGLVGPVLLREGTVGRIEKLKN
jgi:hypothetical protein